MILAAKCFGMDNDLMLGVHQGLGVVPLDHPVGGRHFRRLIIGYVALDFFPALAGFWLLLLQELAQSLHLVLQPLHLLLASFRLGFRQHICTEDTKWAIVL